MKKKLLVICPTRRRPQELERMLDSFYATKSPGTTIIVHVYKNDKYIKEYEKIIGNHYIIYGPERTLVEVLNYCSTSAIYPEFEYYGEVNDDHVYITPGWDKKLIEAIEKQGHGWGVACGENKTKKPWATQRHPSACIISGNIIRTLGYFVWPNIEHIYTDCYLRDMADSIMSLFYLPEVIIEHRHYGNDMAKLDDNYKKVYSGPAWQKGKEAYFDWYKEYRERDMKKIKEARKCSSS